MDRHPGVLSCLAAAGSVAACQCVVLVLTGLRDPATVVVLATNVSAAATVLLLLGPGGGSGFRRLMMRFGASASLAACSVASTDAVLLGLRSPTPALPNVAQAASSFISWSPENLVWRGCGHSARLFLGPWNLRALTLAVFLGLLLVGRRGGGVAALGRGVLATSITLGVTRWLLPELADSLTSVNGKPALVVADRDQVVLLHLRLGLIAGLLTMASSSFRVVAVEFAESAGPAEPHDGLEDALVPREPTEASEAQVKAPDRSEQGSRPPS